MRLYLLLLHLMSIVTITPPDGVYDLTQDINSNLCIKGNDVTFRGNGHTVNGWVHLEIEKGGLCDLTVAPPKLFEHPEGKCPVCGRGCGPSRDGDGCCVMVCTGDGLILRDIELYPPVPLTSFAVANQSATFTRCVFNGVTFDDPPASGFVSRY